MESWNGLGWGHLKAHPIPGLSMGHLPRSQGAPASPWTLPGMQGQPELLQEFWLAPPVSELLLEVVPSLLQRGLERGKVTGAKWGRTNKPSCFPGCLTLGILWECPLYCSPCFQGGDKELTPDSIVFLGKTRNSSLTVSLFSTWRCETSPWLHFLPCFPSGDKELIPDSIVSLVFHVEEKNLIPDFTLFLVFHVEKTNPPRLNFSPCFPAGDKELTPDSIFLLGKTRNSFLTPIFCVFHVEM